MTVIGLWTWTSLGDIPDPPIDDGDGDDFFKYQHKMYQKGWRNRFNRVVSIGIMLFMLVGG